MVELRFLIVELRYLGVDWDCLKISYDFKENLKIDFHQGIDERSEYSTGEKKQFLYGLLLSTAVT